jgi:methionyl-tRNA formyltransferase
MRVAWIGGTHPRHLYYINAVHRRFPLVGALVDQRENLIPQPPDGIAEHDRQNFVRHFATRAEAEERYFGPQSLPECDTRRVTPEEMNGPASAEFLRRLRPDVVLVFGSGLVKPPLADSLPEHTINLHLGLSPRYRGAATLFWPFYFLEPPYAGTTFHYIVAEPDAGEIIHQVVPDLAPEDGIHDVACKAVVASAGAAVTLLKVFERDGAWKRHRQRATGKNFLASDFKPEHLRVIYDVYQDGMVREFFEGRLASKVPTLFRQV